jgi:hypothetical protein
MSDPFSYEFGGAGNMPRLRISLRIFGDDLDPSFITQQLGIAPTESGRKGEPNESSRRGAMSLWETGAWVYRLSVRSDTELGDALDELLAAMPQDATLWEELTSTYAVDVLCGVFLESSAQSTTISADVLARLGRLGLPLAFELHAPSEAVRDSDEE